MAQPSAALALPAPTYAEGPSWRSHEELIDALPYIDPLTPDVKRQVEVLIEEEMRRSTKRPADYLRELPPMLAVPFEGHPMLAAEYERVRAQQPMPPLDVTRFQLAAPSGAAASDPAAWRRAVDNAQAQLEHQHNRVQNLELMLKHGPNTWRAQTQLSEALRTQQEADLAGLKRSVDALNRQRKLKQTSTGLDLRRLEDEWAGLVRRNLQIAAACDDLEGEVVALQARLAGARGGQGAAAAAAAAVDANGEQDAAGEGQDAAGEGQDASVADGGEPKANGVAAGGEQHPTEGETPQQPAGEAMETEDG